MKIILGGHSLEFSAFKKIDPPKLASWRVWRASFRLSQGDFPRFLAPASVFACAQRSGKRLVLSKKEWFHGNYEHFLYECLRKIRGRQNPHRQAVLKMQKIQDVFRTADLVWDVFRTAARKKSWKIIENLARRSWCPLFLSSDKD